MIPYGIHYKCLTQLIKGASNQIVFMVLLDKYHEEAYHQNNLAISLNINDIAKQTNMSWVTVKSAIDYLENHGLLNKSEENNSTLNISIANEECLKIAYIYQTLPTNKRKDLVETFQNYGVAPILENPDYQKLMPYEIFNKGSKVFNNPYEIFNKGYEKFNNPSKVFNKESSENNEEGSKVFNNPYEIFNNPSKLFNKGSKVFNKECFPNSKQNPDELNEGSKVFNNPYEIFNKGMLNDTPAIKFVSELFAKHSMSKDLFDKHFKLIFDKYKVEDYEKIRHEILAGNLIELIDVHPAWIEFLAQSVIYFSTVENNQNATEDLQSKNPENEAALNADKTLNQSSDKNQLIFSAQSNKPDNPYKNKPYFSKEEAMYLTGGVDDVIEYPVDFFVYRFWNDLFEHFRDVHYSVVSDDNGNWIETECDHNDYQMIGSLIPQEDVFHIADNVFRDLEGMVEQGEYIDNEGNTHKLKFNSLEGFNPFFIMDWEVVQNGKTGYFKIALDRFRDIDSPDVIEVKKRRSSNEKELANNQNLKLWEFLCDDASVAVGPLEIALKAFIKKFVVLSPYGPIDKFTDEFGEDFERASRFPDHKLRDWCAGVKGITKDVFVSVLSRRYSGIHGLEVGMYLFDCQRVARWNEMNGFTDTLAHAALKVASM